MTRKVVPDGLQVRFTLPPVRFAACNNIDVLDSREFVESIFKTRLNVLNGHGSLFDHELCLVTVVHHG